MSKHQALSVSELEDALIFINKGTVKLQGNIIFTNKVGNSKVILTDEALPITSEQKIKVVAGIERAIEAIYPGFKCTVTCPDILNDKTIP